MRSVACWLRSVALACLAIALSLGIGLPLTGCDNLFGLDHVEPAPPPGLDNGYVCTCDCTYPDGGMSSVDLGVCAPGALNPNVGGSAPTPVQLWDDCASTRVKVQVQRMARECYARGADCTCRTGGTAEMPEPTTFYNDSCDDQCVARPLVIMDGVCTNWDSSNGIANANCATENLCLDPGPVCLAPFGDLASGMMARVAQCHVDTGSIITVDVDGEMRSLPVGGAVTFLPVACGAGDCVVPSYFFQASGKMEFDALLGLDTVSIEDIRSIGTSSALLLDGSGKGQIAENGSLNSGRAVQREILLGYFEDTEHVAAIGGNDDPVDVLFDGNQCGITGALAGGVGDPEGDNSDFAMTVSIAGTVENTPPDADAGADETVECTDSTGADITLDATGSTDREDNIVSYGWFLATRAGADLGSGPTLTRHQAIGSETYFVKPVDAYMQVDEDDVTVAVVDSVGPSIACNAPATITPRRTPYSFTATASDLCGSVSGAPVVVGYECFAFNSSGKRVTRKCKVQLSGSTFTVIDSGGIGDHFQWTVRAVDADGNTTLQTCETEVVRPGPGPA